MACALGACQSTPVARSEPPPAPRAPELASGGSPAPPLPAPAMTPAPSRQETLIAVSPPQCTAADWEPRRLPPLLHTGKAPNAHWTDQPGASQSLFDPECTDSPGGPARTSQNPVVVSGVQIRLAGATPAGASRRGWTGNQCAFEVRAADGSGAPVVLGPEEIPPFTTVSAVVRSGSAVWLSVSFNGYTAEFPNGGNRIVAVDLCEGRIAWKSKDSMSNGGLLLLDDYLVSPYGFTSERRYVFVLDAHSGGIVQKLPVIENVCPSESWASHWHPGERCDAPGQAVGAATAPRIARGIFLVDTNTGSSAFELASHGRSP
jgi:hypothetical protein